jgi:selenoprotein W-related protein
MAQELLTTFQDDSKLQALSILPSSNSGQFTVTLYSQSDSVVLWDRKEKGCFPEMKQLKQLLRDQVEPTRNLGHSDTEERKTHGEEASVMESEAKNIPSSSLSSVPFTLPKLQNAPSPNVAIVYCTGCKWLFRAAWFAQEFMQTFADELESVSLLPTRPPIQGGTFQIYLNEKRLWDRAEQGEFPDIKTIKQLLRDELNPAKSLGHVDRQHTSFDTMDDDDAEEARRMFGVL